MDDGHTWIELTDVRERVDWPLDDRRIYLGWSPADVVAWFVTLPLGALGALTALVSVDGLVHGTQWLPRAGALVGLLLGSAVAWGWLRGVLRLVLHFVAPELVEVRGGVTVVKLRPDWRRSSLRFDAGAIVAACLAAGQGNQATVWLTHRDGRSLYLAGREAGEARSLLIRLTR